MLISKCLHETWVKLSQIRLYTSEQWTRLYIDAVIIFPSNWSSSILQTASTWSFTPHLGLREYEPWQWLSVCTEVCYSEEGPRSPPPSSLGWELKFRDNQEWSCNDQSYPRHLILIPRYTLGIRGGPWFGISVSTLLSTDCTGCLFSVRSLELSLCILIKTLRTDISPELSRSSSLTTPPLTPTPTPWSRWQVRSYHYPPHPTLHSLLTRANHQSLYMCVCM